MKRGMSSRRLASDSSGSRPSSERSASHNHRFQKSSISQDRQLESRKRARSESSGHSGHVRAASRDETGRKAVETSSNFGQLTLGSTGEPSPICVIPEVEVFDGAPSKRRDRRLSNDGASTSSDNQGTKSGSSSHRFRDESTAFRRFDTANKPGILVEYPGNAFSAYPHDFSMSSLPEFSKLSREQMAMLPENLRMRSSHGDWDPHRRHPWDEILANREHPSPLYGRPSAQRCSPIYGSSMGCRSFDGDGHKSVGPPSLFSSPISHFQSKVSTTYSFSKRELVSMERQEGTRHQNQSVANVSNVSRTEFPTREGDNTDSDEDDDYGDEVDYGDDVFMKPSPTAGECPAAKFLSRHTITSSTPRRLPNSAWLKSLSSSERAQSDRSKEGDSGLHSRSRSLDDDCLIVETKPSSRPATTGADEESSIGGERTDEEAKSFSSSTRAETSLAPSLFTSKIVEAGISPASPAVPHSQNLFSRAFMPEAGCEAATGMDRRRNPLPITTETTFVEQHSEPTFQPHEGEADLKPAPDVTKSGKEETSFNQFRAPANDPEEESNDSVLSDFGSDWFPCREPIKTFSIGDDYVLDDAPVNFFGQPLENSNCFESAYPPSTERADVRASQDERVAEKDESKSFDPDVRQEEGTSFDSSFLFDRSWKVRFEEINARHEAEYPTAGKNEHRDVTPYEEEVEEMAHSRASAPFSSEEECSRDRFPNPSCSSDDSETQLLDVDGGRRPSVSSDDSESHRINEILSFSRSQQALFRKDEASDYSDSDSDDSYYTANGKESYYDHPADFYSPRQKPNYDDYDDEDVEVVNEYDDETVEEESIDMEEGNVTEVLSDESEVDMEPRQNPPSPRVECLEMPDVIPNEVLADARQLVDELILIVGSIEEERKPKCSVLTPEELEDEVLIFLSDIINEIDPSLCFDQVQTDAYNKLYCTVAIGAPDEVLICDKALEVSVTRCSLKTLIEEVPYKKLSAKSHVNDEVINSYMALIRHRSIQYPAQLPKVFTFSTFFFESLRNGGHERVKRWTRGKDIFQYDMIIIPLNFKSEHHWALFIIDLSAKVFVHYDSLLNRDLSKYKQLKLTKQVKIVNMFRDYLIKEVSHKQSTYDLNLKVFKVDFCIRYPQQRNLIDCGVFCMRFAEGYTRSGNIDFCQADMLHYRKQICLELDSLQVPLVPR